MKVFGLQFVVNAPETFVSSNKIIIIILSVFLFLSNGGIIKNGYIGNRLHKGPVVIRQLDHNSIVTCKAVLVQKSL